MVVKQAVARQFQLTPVPVAEDPPAKRAKKMKESVAPLAQAATLAQAVSIERHKVCSRENS